MKTFVAEIDVSPLKQILDPQGKAVKLGLTHLEIHNVEDVRVGKHISMTLKAADAQAADKIVRESCEKLLVNKIMEDYAYIIMEQEEAELES